MKSLLQSQDVSAEANTKTSVSLFRTAINTLFCVCEIRGLFPPPWSTVRLPGHPQQPTDQWLWFPTVVSDLRAHQAPPGTRMSFIRTGCPISAALDDERAVNYHLRSRLLNPPIAQRKRVFIIGAPSITCLQCAMIFRGLVGCVYSPGKGRSASDLRRATRGVIAICLGHRHLADGLDACFLLSKQPHSDQEFRVCLNMAGKQLGC